ncbi:MAG: energy-coupling factor transporter transmembrane component T, partial [Oscillospiraceae bacterium]
IPLFIVITITNPLFSHNGITPLFFLNGNPVTFEAFMYGIAIAVMIIAVMFWCKCYNQIMTSDKFLYLFGKAIPKLSLVLSMALRFIPMFKSQMQKVNRAQKTMGLYSSKNYIDKLKSGMRVLSAIITWSLENSIETSSSMKARGYGLKGRSNFSLFHFTKNDLVMLGLIIILILSTLFGIASGQTEFFFYPYISDINKSFFAIFTYTSYGLLTFLPFLIEIKENIKWKFYISKI